jgi:hypothetical protein
MLDAVIFENPWVIITTDDAAWAVAHDGELPVVTDPAHPPKNGNDDVLIAIDAPDPKIFTEGKDCPPVKDTK